MRKIPSFVLFNFLALAASQITSFSWLSVNNKLASIPNCDGGQIFFTEANILIGEIDIKNLGENPSLEAIIWLSAEKTPSKVVISLDEFVIAEEDTNFFEIICFTNKMNQFIKINKRINISKQTTKGILTIQSKSTFVSSIGISHLELKNTDSSALGNFNSLPRFLSTSSSTPSSNTTRGSPIVGIIFGVIFGVLVIAIIVYKKIRDKKKSKAQADVLPNDTLSASGINMQEHQILGYQTQTQEDINSMEILKPDGNFVQNQGQNHYTQQQLNNRGLYNSGQSYIGQGNMIFNNQQFYHQSQPVMIQNQSFQQAYQQNPQQYQA